MVYYFFRYIQKWFYIYFPEIEFVHEVFPISFLSPARFYGLWLYLFAYGSQILWEGIHYHILKEKCCIDKQGG